MKTNVVARVPGCVCEDCSLESARLESARLMAGAARRCGMKLNALLKMTPDYWRAAVVRAWAE